MFMYRLIPQSLPATCRSLAQTSINALFPSGKAPMAMYPEYAYDYVRIGFMLYGAMPGI